MGCASNNSESTESEGKSKEEGSEELNFAYSQQPASLDVHTNTNTATSDVMLHVYETLITVDSDYNIKPMLADEWEQSDDGKTITFKLRKDVKFHNGEEMLADDVVASMDRWKKSPGSREQFEDAEFKAEDDHTVVMKMPDPFSTALPALAHSGTGLAGIMPKEIVEDAPEGEDEEANEYIGTGPFQFEEWEQDQYVHLSKFEDYVPREEESDGFSGKKEALVNDIYFRFVTDVSTRESGIQSGEYDVAQAIARDNEEQLNSVEEIDTFKYTNSAQVIHFNKRQGLFKDKKAREAVAAVLDVDSIATSAFVNEDNYNKNHNFMFTDQTEQWSSDIGKEDYNQNDPAKAKKLLEEIDYDGEEVRIITSRDGDDSYNASVVILEQLKEIGLNADIEVYDWSSLMSAREDESKYEIFVIGNTPVADPISTVFLRSDYPGWAEDDKLEDLVSEFRSKSSLEDAQAMFDDLQKWYWDYIPAIRIAEGKELSAKREGVSDIHHQNGFHLWNVSNEE